MTNDVSEKDFDWLFYIEYNKFLLETIDIKTKEQAEQHYISFGKTKGLICNRNQFDWQYYLDKYPDVAQSDFGTQNKAKDHYIRHGNKEGRFSNRYKEELSHKNIEECNNNSIQYDVIQENKTSNFINNKLWAHLHCYNIDKFDEIYGEYIENIMKYFSVLVTFAEGSNIPKLNVLLIKVNLNHEYEKI